MKRIAIIHEEFLSEGMPAALHVNGRTETDFQRWTAYVRERQEVTHIAYEFTTGTGWATRRDQHVSWLVRLAYEVGRPLHLVVRGGLELLPRLSATFDGVSFVDTSIFMKTMMRREAISVGNDRLSWRPSPTEVGAPLDGLLAKNFAVVESLVNLTNARPVMVRKLDASPA